MAELLVVATPIGNLQDLTPRMADALSRADLIAAEDTRVTMKLLNHLSIKTPLISYHRHNEAARASSIVERMIREDLTIALTCDAGTPAVSDPGALLVNAARAANVRVTPVCGPSAAIAALSVSGFDTSTFAFYGFLPREKKPLREKLGAILKSGNPIAVVYESPHRIASLSGEIAAAWPEARLCVCSDISKRFERAFYGSSGEVHQQLLAGENVEKGEYCLVIDLSAVKVPETEKAEMSAELYILNLMLQGVALDEAASRAATAGYARNALYKARLKIMEVFAPE